MLSPANRLTKDKEINRVYRKARPRGDGEYLLFALPNRQTMNRFAFVISKKVGKSAVVRNRDRRLCRESIRKVLPSLTPGYDVIIQIRKTKDRKQQDVEIQLQRLLYRCGLWQPRAASSSNRAEPSQVHHDTVH